MENNVLTHLMKSVNQNTIDTVKIQLLQTLSILIQNLKSEMALCKASIFILIGNFIHFFTIYQFIYCQIITLMN